MLPIQAIALTLFFFALGLIYVAVVRGQPSDKVWAYTVGFVIRLLVFGLLGLFLSFHLDDELVFHTVAADPPIDLFILGEGNGYYHLVSWLYAGFSSDLIFPRVLSVFVGSVLPFFVYDLARYVDDNEKAARIALWMTVFAPPLVIYSTVAMREILIASFFVLAILSIRLAARARLAGIGLLGVSVGMLYWIPGLLWAGIGAIGATVAFLFGETWSPADFRKSRSAQLRLAFVLILALLAIPVVLELGELAQDRLEGPLFDQFLESQASIMSFIDLENPLSLRNFGVLFARGIWSPIPFRFVLDAGISPILEAMTAWSWYILAPLALIGLIKSRHRGAAIACGAVTLLIVGIASMGTIIGSDIVRHRIPLFAVIVPLAAVAANRDTIQKYRWIIVVWILVSVAATLIWASIRL